MCAKRTAEVAYPWDARVAPLSGRCLAVEYLRNTPPNDVRPAANPAPAVIRQCSILMITPSRKSG